jgi:hypothetical protein
MTLLWEIALYNVNDQEFRQSLPDLTCALPLQKNRREIRIKGQLLLSTPS